MDGRVALWRSRAGQKSYHRSYRGKRQDEVGRQEGSSCSLISSSPLLTVRQAEGFKNNHRVPYRLERYVPVGGSLEFQETLYYSDTVKEDHIYYEHPGESIPHIAQSRLADQHLQISISLASLSSASRNGGNVSIPTLTTRLAKNT